MRKSWGFQPKFFLLFLLFLAIEVLIALFVHDRFIRPYVGDMLVVVVLYCLVRSVWLGANRLLPLYLFLFAAAVEFSQYFNLVERLGLAGNRFLRVLLGMTFDWADLGCYLVGCLLLAGVEILFPLWHNGK